MRLKVLLYGGEDGYVIAECRALPGCVSQGETHEEALANIREAIEGWLEVQQERQGAPAVDADVQIVELTV
jgi:predicted RNase H-like HicB family nuclease